MGLLIRSSTHLLPIEECIPILKICQAFLQVVADNIENMAMNKDIFNSTTQVSLRNKTILSQNTLILR
jgi:hypothetical protein